MLLFLINFILLEPNPRPVTAGKPEINYLMKKKFIILITFCSLFIVKANAKTYFVATTGNDLTNTGTIDSPFATIIFAQKAVLPGDTVYIRGGNYIMAENQIMRKQRIWAIMHLLDKSGEPGKRINYWAYPGEKPVIDMTNVKPFNQRVMAFNVTGSLIHIKGLEVIGTQVTMKGHTQSECFHNEGSHNIYEQLAMHDGQAIGFYLIKGSDNLILNCDAYRNWDYTSEGGRGGNTDGFGCHPQVGDTGNVFRACRAWLNSDDGYDCIRASESILFDHCWAFYNGFSTGYTSHGDGNGFKMGGYGQAPIVSYLPNPIPSFTIQFCLSFRNKANGFYANHHVESGSKWYNNTAYRNTVNFNMLSQRISKSSKTDKDTTLDCPGLNHILKNNLSVKYLSQRDTLNLGRSTNVFNSFTSGLGIVVDETDFISLDETELLAERHKDGSLPEINFLRPKVTSDLIDKGINLGFSYHGKAPDLGAFETK